MATKDQLKLCCFKDNLIVSIRSFVRVHTLTTKTVWRSLSQHETRFCLKSKSIDLTALVVQACYRKSCRHALFCSWGDFTITVLAIKYKVYNLQVVLHMCDSRHYLTYGDLSRRNTVPRFPPRAVQKLVLNCTARRVSSKLSCLAKKRRVMGTDLVELWSPPTLLSWRFLSETYQYLNLSELIRT